MSARHKRPGAQLEAPADAATEYPPGLVGVPCVDWMYTAAAESLVNLTQCLPAGSRISFTHGQGSSIAGNRNALVRTLLKHSELRWLFMLDSDMLAPQDAVMRLLATGKSIVSGLYFDRRPPHVIGAGRWGEMPEGAPFILHRVPMVGGGCLLVHRRVFEAMPESWFEHATVPGWGEDAYFAHKASEAGFELWLDGTIEVGHIGTTVINREYAEAWARTPTAATQNAALHRQVVDMVNERLGLGASRPA